MIKKILIILFNLSTIAMFTVIFPNVLGVWSTWLTTLVFIPFALNFGWMVAIANAYYLNK